MKKIMFSLVVVFLLSFFVILVTDDSGGTAIGKDIVHKEVPTVIVNTVEFVSSSIETIQKEEEVEPEIIEFTTYDVPETSGYKSFMPYAVNGKSIFSSNSNQRKLQELCVTGDYGIRMYNDRYCVAIGSAFGTYIGQYFDLILENGTVIPCVMADQKADCHTNSDNIVTSANGCISEFIVDYDSLVSMAMKMGDVSYCNELWRSRVISVKVYEDGVTLE